MKLGFTNITYEMVGYLDPCIPKCRPSLRDQAISDMEVTTTYTSIVGEKNRWTFAPTTHQSRGQSLRAVEQTKVNIQSGKGDTATYWRSPTSNKWRHSKIKEVNHEQ